MNLSTIFLVVALCVTVNGVGQYTILYEDFQDPITFIDECNYSFGFQTDQWVITSYSEPVVNSSNVTPAGYVGFDSNGDQLVAGEVWPYDYWIGMDNIWNSGEVDPVDTNFVLAATSFYITPSLSAVNVVTTPPIFVPHTDVDLKWKSAPYWFPYFSDGYKVYITTGTSAYNYFDLQTFSPVWIQAESTGYAPNDPSFQPTTGYVHGNGGTDPQYFYDCPTPGIDKGALEPHEIGLGAYAGQWIRIAFYHDSTDDFVLTLDDIEVVANSGDNSCIDMNEADPFAVCTTLFDPVCGCDGNTYTNACIATDFFGVQSYTEGACSVIFTGVPEDETEECGVSCNWWDYLEYEPPVVTASINGDPIAVEAFSEIVQLCEFDGGFEAQVFYTAFFNGETYFEDYVYRCEDTQVPIWTSFPSDIEIACWDDGIPVPDFPTAFDDCAGDNVEVFVVNSAESPVCPETFVDVYEWHAVDGCGNELVDYSYVTAVDLDAPEITCPSNAVVSSLSAADPSITGVATAFDFCDFEVAVSYNDGTVTGENPASFVRTWTATDYCGNSATCDQIISEPGCDPLTISAAANLTLECGVEIPEADYTVSGGCLPLDIQISEEQDAGCGETVTIIRFYSVTDATGFIATDTQVITVVDTNAPNINAASNLTIECGNSIPNPNASVSDTCGDATWTVSESSQSLCGDSEQIIRTYTAIDDCGNTAIDTQVITIVDTTPPAINAASNVTIECGNSIPSPSASVSDDCGDATWTVSESSESLCGDTEQIFRIYTATDDCGNTATDSQVITVVDTTPPSINAASNMTIECGDPIPSPSASISDSCGDATWTVSESTESLCGDTEQIFRTYIALDECGNSAIDTQVITVVDTTVPAIICPPNVNVDDIENAEPSETGAATGSDLCGSVTISFSDGPITGIPGAFIRTWIATDACGNSKTCDQNISESECDPLNLSAEIDLTLECGAEIPDGDFTVSGGCLPVDVETSEDLVDGCGETFVITRTYVATDASGIVATATQVITVVDTTAPTAVADPDSTIECGDNLPAPDLTTSDSCGDVTWSVSETEESLCGETKQFIRTYTAEDDCGNSTIETQVITTIDSTPPVIECPPDTEVSDLGNAPPSLTGFGIVSDNCGEAVRSFTDEIVSGPEGIIRTWTATDDCGNTSNCDQFIELVVGLLENEYSIDFVTVPNPSNGQITLYLNESLSDEFNWTCFDLVGKAIESGQEQTVNGRADLDLSGISTGAYFLLVEFKEGRGIQKIQIYR